MPGRDLGVLFRVLALASLLGALASSAGCVPAAPAAAQSPTGPCTIDAECTLFDDCGCSCRAVLGRGLPPATCSGACDGRPCDGHVARCRDGTCIME